MMPIFFNHGKTPMLNALSVGVVAALSLSACGGGGGGGSSTTTTPVTTAPTTPVATNTNLSKIQGDSTGVTGQSLGLVFVKDSQDTTQYDSMQWVQQAGPAVTFTSDKQSAVSFTPVQAGTYTFALNLYKGTTLVKTLTQTVTVTQATTSAASLRSDRAVGSGGSFSLRFYTPAPLSASEWTLTQVGGTHATLRFDAYEALANITVPEVTRDEVLTFKATAKNNPSWTDTVYVVVKANTTSLPDMYFCNSADAANSCLPLNSLTNNYAYLPQGKYANNLAKCVMSNILNDNYSCSMSTLPFIGYEAKDPSIEQIMSRVVVSHDWMAKNFEAFLRQYDTNNDFKRLLRSTTAIVISDAVRPSFYWAGTGTIYIDPDYLWMTPEQRDDIPEIADYRVGFSSGLNYVDMYDYEKNGQSVVYNEAYYPDVNLRQSRTLETISMPLASLLYHELSHANDYMPATAINALTAGQQYLAPYEVMPASSISDKLASQSPLLDARLKSLAQVTFGGKTPTAAEQQYTAADVGSWFFADRGTDMYNFFDPAEDLAMLFEESMMLSRFGVNRYIMFMTPKTNSDPNYRVARGEKNWVASNNAEPRANFVVSNILPEASSLVQGKLATLNSTPLCAGTTFFSYYNTNCTTNQYTAPHAYFGKYHNRLPKGPVRGIAPIGAPGVKR